MKLYVIRNHEGKFFRPKGMSSASKNWIDTLEKAKFYTKLGIANSQVSYWYNNYKQFPCPQILEFDLDESKAIVRDSEKEAKSNRIKKLRKDITRLKKYLVKYSSTFDQYYVDSLKKSEKELKELENPA